MRTAPLIVLPLLAVACASPGSYNPFALPSGPASPTCVKGWTTPAPGSALRTYALDIIGSSLDLSPDATLVVEEMRYFTGPEDVGISTPRRDAERWYVKASVQGEPSVAGRWIVRRTDVGAGVAYLAAHATTGYEPGVWTGLEGEGATYDPFTPPCTATHGPYCACDWGVSGCSCTDSGHPVCTGPPPEVMGCLAGT